MKVPNIVDVTHDHHQINQGSRLHAIPSNSLQHQRIEDCLHHRSHTVKVAVADPDITVAPNTQAMQLRMENNRAAEEPVAVLFAIKAAVSRRKNRSTLREKVQDNYRAMKCAHLSRRAKISEAKSMKISSAANNNMIPTIQNQLTSARDEANNNS